MLKKNFFADLNNIGEAVIVVNKLAYIEYMNTSAEELSGWKIDKIKGKKIGYIFHTIDKERKDYIEYTIKKLIDEETYFSFLENIRMLSNYQNIIPIDICATPIKDEQGISGAVLILRDISKKIDAERIIHQQAAAMMASIDGMAILDRNGRYIYANKALAEIYAYKISDLKNMRWQDLISENEYKRFKKKILPILISKGKWRGEAIGKKSDGSSFPQEIFLSIVEGNSYACVVRDISKRRKMENDLKNNKDKIEKLHRIAIKMEACKKEEEVYCLTVDAAESILNLSICTFDIVENDRFIVKAISSGMPIAGSISYSIDEGIAGMTYNNKRSYLVKNVKDYSEFSPARSEYRSVMSIPVDEFGIFQVASYKVNFFDEEDLKLTELLISNSIAVLCQDLLELNFN